MGQKMQGVRILLVEDDMGIKEVLSDILEDEGFDVKTVTHGSNALSAIEKEDFDIVLTYLKSSKINGMEFLDYIKQNRPDIKMIVMKNYTGKKNVYTGKGSFELLCKALQIKELKEELRKAINYNNYFSVNPSIIFLTGSPPEEKLTIIIIPANLANVSKAALFLTLYIPDTPGEGYIYIYGNREIELPWKLSHYHEHITCNSFPINKSSLMQGKNYIRFTLIGIRLYFSGYDDTIPPAKILIT